jgi:hypothetical protein
MIKMILDLVPELTNCRRPNPAIGTRRHYAMAREACNLNLLQPSQKAVSGVVCHKTTLHRRKHKTEIGTMTEIKKAACIMVIIDAPLYEIPKLPSLKSRNRNAPAFQAAGARERVARRNICSVGGDGVDGAPSR